MSVLFGISLIFSYLGLYDPTNDKKGQGGNYPNNKKFSKISEKIGFIGANLFDVKKFLAFNDF